MADTNKRTRSNTDNTDKNRDEPFYESLPASYDHFVQAFPEAEAEERERDDELLTAEEDQPAASPEDQKFTAIITILLVTFVAVLLGVLFLRGLDTIKSNAPNQSAPGGVLNLK